MKKNYPNKPTLFMLSGLPASGKSTYAKNLYDDLTYHGEEVYRVNKDLLRTMMHFDNWTYLNEKVIKDVEYRIAHNVLAGGSSVIIDDTNLPLQRNLTAYSDLASKLGVNFEHHPMELQPFNEYVLRDRARKNGVGKSVILSMALRNNLFQHNSKGIILCDIDNTVSNAKWREPLIRGREKNWDKFYSSSTEDAIIGETFGFLKSLVYYGYTLVFLTGRPERYKNITESWLDKSLGLPYAGVIYRQNGDHSSTEHFKKKVLDKYFANNQLKEIVYVIDDYGPVLQMFKDYFSKRGLTNTRIINSVSLVKRSN